MNTTELKAPDSDCPYCNGTGEADSGGTHPWGAPATIPCRCMYEDPFHVHVSAYNNIAAQLEDAQGEIRALRATEAGLRDRLAAVEADRAQRVPVVSVRDAATKKGPLWDKFSAVYDALIGREITTREIAWRCFLAASTPAQPAQQEPLLVLAKSLLEDWANSFVDCIEGGEADEGVAATRSAVAQIEAVLAAQHQEPPQPVERKPMTYREIADATSEWAHVRSDYTIGIIRAAERHHGIKE